MIFDVDNDSLRSSVIDIVMTSLNDAQIEVRVKAAQVLGGMVNCSFVTSVAAADIMTRLRLTLDTCTRDHGSSGHVASVTTKSASVKSDQSGSGHLNNDTSTTKYESSDHSTNENVLVDHRKNGNVTSDTSVIRHGAVLGLSSFVTAFPHTVPSYVPDLLLYLGRFLHDKQPIPGIKLYPAYSSYTFLYLMSLVLVIKGLRV